MPIKLVKFTNRTSNGAFYVNPTSVTSVESEAHSDNTRIGLVDGSKVSVLESLDEVVRKLEGADSSIEHGS
jgi:uncharacterized protein YlzI (FlbEa/FlbD family)